MLRNLRQHLPQHSPLSNRISMTRLLGFLALLPLPLLAGCEALSPTPVGSISGQVAIEGQGIGGVVVTLSSGASTTTAPTGTYRFDQVQGGTYSVAISGYPLDATFHATSVPAEIVSDGQTVIVDFRGEYIRTASIMGRVAVEGQSLSGVTVRLAGMSEGLTSTNEVGQFAFQSLRAGTYDVTISDFGEAEFPTTSQSASLSVGESKVISFEGTHIRRSNVSVRVSVDGKGLQGVNLRLAGQDEAANAVTDSTGRHTFSELRAGSYSLEISGFDSDEVGFLTTTQMVTVAVDETQNVTFDGKYLRTAIIVGRVSVEGTGLPGVTVTVSGQREEFISATNNDGQYAFGRLHAGTYSVEISGFDTAEVAFPTTTQRVTVGSDEAKSVYFDGTSLRTASIQGRVTIDGEGFEGVTVSLIGGPDGVSHTTTTDASGQYWFTKLLAGNYAVSISGYDPDDYEFEVTSQTVRIALGETANVPFRGVSLVISGVSGRVSSEGMGLSGVLVTLLRRTADVTANTFTSGLYTFTDAGGLYAFGGLEAGDYTMIVHACFAETSKNVTLHRGMTSIVNFEGPLTAASLTSPRNLTADVEGTSVELNWYAPRSDGGYEIVGYEIDVSDDGSSWSLLIVQDTRTQYRDTGLTPGRTRLYRVAAISVQGRLECPSNVVIATSVPSAPTNLTARPVGTSQIDLAWQAPGNDGGIAGLGYRVEGSSNGGRTWRIIRSNTGSTATRYSHRGLQPASTWHYRVSAINRAGEKPSLERRAGDDRGDHSGRAPEPDGRSGRHVADRPVVAGPGHRWRRPGHRLPCRCLLGQRGHQLADLGSEHAQHEHLLCAHGPRTREYKALPRLGDQPSRSRTCVGHRKCNDGRHRARPSGRAFLGERGPNAHAPCGCSEAP